LNVPIHDLLGLIGLITLAQVGNIHNLLSLRAEGVERWSCLNRRLPLSQRRLGRVRGARRLFWHQNAVKSKN